MTSHLGLENDGPGDLERDDARRPCTFVHSSSSFLLLVLICNLGSLVHFDEAWYKKHPSIEELGTQDPGPFITSAEHRPTKLIAT